MPRAKAFRLRPSQIQPLVRIAHRQKAGFSIPERIIFDHELVLIVKGQGTWKIEGQMLDYRQHDLLFIPAFTPHSFNQVKGESEHLAVHFDFNEAVPQARDAVSDREPYRVAFTQRLTLPRQQSLVAGHRWARELGGVIREHGMRRELDSARASARLAGVLLEMLTEKTTNRASTEPSRLRDQDRVNQIVAHMRANLQAPLDHGDLEKVSALSKSRLQILFREMTGYSPLDYLRRLRVEEARGLLADRKLSVKEIAALTGFRDTSHLSKVFRRIDGLSPAHYREALLAGQRE